MSLEFKKELQKAIQLSVFISVIVFGILTIGNRPRLDDSARAPASVAARANKRPCVPGEAQGRAVPPFEKSPCNVTQPR